MLPFYLKIPQSSVKGDLDRAFAGRVLEMVRTSSIDRAVILAQDHVYDDSGRLMERFGPFYTPNDYVLRLARNHEEFLPAASIHPARPDALDELERCIEAGAVMLKILPLYHNIDCSDRRYVPFWERMAKAGMLLLAHTGGELSLPVANQKYASPAPLSLPLECGVTVIAAHCATSSLDEENYLPLLEKMMERHPRLYGDNSGLNTPVRSRHLWSCLTLSDRIVHGSDLPIPVSGWWAAARGMVGLTEAFDIGREKNLVERDAKLKAALGFEPSTFTRLSELLPLKRS